MSIQGIVLAGFEVFLKHTYTSASTTTIECSGTPRQSKKKITGIACTGPEYKLIFTDIPPITDREDVKLSRTCKLFHNAHTNESLDQKKSDIGNVLEKFTRVVEMEVSR